MNKLLCCIAILSISIFGNIEVNASDSLHDLFNNEEITVEFDRKGTVYYYNNTVQSVKKTELDKSQYRHYVGAYYIDINTIPLLNNTVGVGEVKASIVCDNSISLQNWSNSNLNSITFSGKSSNYTGAFYLHPAINNIVFKEQNTGQDSVIKYINIPTSGIKRRITIDYPDNFKAFLVIQGNLDINITHKTPNILHFSKINGRQNEIQNGSINLGTNSIIYQKQKDSLKNYFLYSCNRYFQL